MKKFLHKKKGQISILIILSLIPLFTLFAFVVNIGMLVNAKIALQNAADLAAYAGAATQARQLTHISHVNYQMRQTYKKFLFKLYVIGSMSQKCYPGNSPAAGCGSFADQSPYNWANPGGIGFPGVPAVCLTLSRDSNPCQLGRAVPLVQAVSCISMMDPACSVLANAAAAIQEIQNASCKGNSVANFEAATHWLYATDVNSEFRSTEALRGLVTEVGLVTEELIHRARITTLQSYVNEPAKAGLTNRQISRLMDGLDQARVERTVLSFNTAYFNLNHDVFNPDSIIFSELMPDGGGLYLEDIKPSFEVPVVLMDGQNPAAGCNLKLEFLRANPIVGVYSTENTHVFYAVKLQAKAKLLFNPFPFGNPDGEGIELTAYSAAKPFGSRIGPALPTSAFVRDQPAVINSSSGATLPKPIPYLGLTEGATQTDMYTAGVLRNLYGTIRPDPIDFVSFQEIDRGLKAAILPDEIEVGKYNIPVDVENLFQGDPLGKMVSYYQGGNSEYTFWAPIVPPGGNISEVKDKIKAGIEDNISFSTTGAVGPAIGAVGSAIVTVDSDLEQARPVLALTLINRIEGYMNSTLRNSANYNVARMLNPLTALTLTPPPNIPGKQINPRILATSYVTDHDPKYYNAGRDGYSVKHIPFRMLLQTPGKLANLTGTTSWQAVRDNMKGEKPELLKLAH